MRTIVFLLSVSPTAGAQAPAHMMADINGADSTAVTPPQNLTNVNGTLFFVGSDESGDCALWRSDGTTAGTLPVKVFPNITASDCRSAFIDLTNVNGTLFFCFGEGDLWKSDGTTAGTLAIRGFAYQGPNHLTAVGATLFFDAFDAASGDELWKSDGSAVGTIVVRDIVPGADSSFPYGLTNVDGTLFFFATDRLVDPNSFLWRSDGTPGGTVPIKNLGSSFPFHLTNANGTLFFTMGNRDIWKSDATEAGTVPVKLNLGDFEVFPADLTAVGSALFFRIGTTLWKSDGTEAGTAPVGTGIATQDLIAFRGALFFVNESGETGMWRSDGTEAGTIRVSAVIPFDNLTAVKDTLFFSAAGNRNAGPQLWKSDGTEAGTMEVSDIEYISPNVSGPSNLTNVDGTLFFTRENGELWKSDGTTAGTGPVKFVVATPTQTATVTATSAATPTPPSSQTQMATPRPTATPTPALCIGDCGGIGVVAVNDIITLVNIALGTAQPSACAHGVANGADVTVAVIIHAVNDALNGCSAS